MGLEKIVSGGQTGADQAGLASALSLGIPHGGWCPKGRKSEDGRIPDCYLMKEHEKEEYPPRTWANVRDSDGTVIFTLGELERGSKLTSDFCDKQKKPWVHFDLSKVNDTQAAVKLSRFIRDNEIKTLNVAGNRESKSPGIFVSVVLVMVRALWTRQNGKKRNDGQKESHPEVS